MRKEKFVYNTQTLRYEKVVEPLRTKVLRLFGFLSAVLVAAFIIISITLKYFPSPKEKALIREFKQMEYMYMQLNNDVENLTKVLNNVQDRDASVHRLMFGMDPIDKNVWEGGIGGHNKYDKLTKYKRTGDLLYATLDKVGKLKQQMAVQSKSLDTILTLANDRETMLASMPAIKPIRSDKLSRNIRSLSGFGMRLHPIFKRKKRHTGIDFTSPKGTAVQATGNGKVHKVLNKRSGYGTHIIIDHGYGFKTLYAHLSAVDVKVGQKVVRGQVIGKVGSTGTSTAPHLHYEVILKGVKVNPIHYCMDGLTPKQYQELADMAAISNQSFD
ncbi:MAG: M23 family metallopeptidase [Saprospiraceae bacterium]